MGYLIKAKKPIRGQAWVSIPDLQRSYDYVWTWRRCNAFRFYTRRHAEEYMSDVGIVNAKVVWTLF